MRESGAPGSNPRLSLSAVGREADPWVLQASVPSSAKQHQHDREDSMVETENEIRRGGKMGDREEEVKGSRSTIWLRNSRRV